MTREEAAKRWEWVIENFNDSSVYLWPDQRQELLASIALLRGPQPDPKTGLVPCGGKMRIDIPPGNDSVRASPGFQRDGGDKTERWCMANQCVICGAEMPEGDQVCGYCRRQHGY